MNISLAAVGVAKQTDKTTAATNPAYYHGVDGGILVSPEITTQTDEVTTGLASPSDAYRESAAMAVDFGTRAFKKAVGLYLLGILGDVDTTGASAPYTHVFTAGDAIPWLTFFSKLDGEYRKAVGCKLDEVKVDWDGTKPLAVTVVGAGMTITRVASVTKPAGEETLGEKFMPLGGTYELDVDGTTLASYPILKASISLKRNIEADYSCASIAPSDINEGTLTAEVELTARVANLDDFWTIATGATDGTSMAEEPVYGSFEIASIDGTDELTFAASKVAFTADAQEADPAGGPAELVIKGQMLIASGETSPISVTLKNSVASY